MDHNSKDLLVVEFEPEEEMGELVEEISGQIDMTPLESRPTGPAEISNANPSVLIGTLAAWDDAGNPLVDYPNNPGECFLPARTLVPLNQASLGREVALLLAEGDPRQPLIIGLLQSPHAKPTNDGRPVVAAEIDGERLVFTADQEIVFRCGQASLTLTRAGKILIRGTYLLSRSSGVNRIKGGSVQIN